MLKDGECGVRAGKGAGGTQGSSLCDGLYCWRNCKMETHPHEGLNLHLGINYGHNTGQNRTVVLSGLVGQQPETKVFDIAKKSKVVISSTWLKCCCHCSGGRGQTSVPRSQGQEPGTRSPFPECLPSRHAHSQCGRWWKWWSWAKVCCRQIVPPNPAAPQQPPAHPFVVTRTETRCFWPQPGTTLSTELPCRANLSTLGLPER